MGPVPGSGRSPGEGNGNSFQYSCLENPMDRAAWQVTVHGVAKGQTRLSKTNQKQQLSVARDLDLTFNGPSRYIMKGK